jgi:hypothetical protein
MGMIILIAFLLLGICAGLKAIFYPSSLELNKENVKLLSTLYFLAFLVPALFTIWAATLINTKIVVLLTAAYLAWNTCDISRCQKRVLKAISNGEGQIAPLPAYCRVPFRVIEVAYLGYLVWCLYLLI